MLEVATKLVDVEGIHASQSVAHCHLVIILDVFIHVADVFLVGEGVRNPLAQGGLVALGMKQYGIGLQPVAPGTTGFLEIGFGRIGHVDVDDQTHVGLVNPHTECIGGYHHPAFARLPAFLSLVLHVVVQSGMIEGRCDSMAGNQFRYLTGTFPVTGIDDGGTVHTFQYVNQFLGLVFGVADNIGKVLPFKAHAEGLCPFPEAQLHLNVFDYLRCGGSGQCQYRDIGEHLADVGNLQIGGAEVVPPLGDAMRLVHRNHADLHASELGLEDFRVQSFGGDIEEFVIAEDAVFQCHHDFFACHAGVDGQCLDASFAEVAHLVLHQGYQRGNDQTQSFLAQCRYLEGDGFPSSGWHEP